MTKLVPLLAIMALFLGLVTVVHAQSAVNICSRTAEVQAAILASVTGSPTCSTITDTQLAAITQLEVTGYSNVSIVPGDFAGLTGLESLEIVDSPSLTTVPANAFSEVTGLTTLQLIRNAISSVDADAFDGLTKLEILGLRYSRITTLNEDIFDGLTILTQIRLNNNEIATLHEDIFNGLTYLEEIQLQDNKIATLHEDTFDGLGLRLATLYLENNEITTLHEDIFDGTTSLRNLVLSDNNLTTLHEDIFDGLTRLIEIDLDNNEITTLHEDIFDSVTTLKFLFLSNNKIATLDEDIFDGLASMNWLVLSGNRLTALDADLFEPFDNSLESLELSDNLLTTLPDDIFEGLTGLYWLEFNGNSITTLDADLFDPLDSSLGELYFSDNLLTALPADLFDGLTGLDVLDTSCNGLTALDLDLFDPFSTSLEKLDIRRNNFSMAPTDAALRAKLTNIVNLHTGDDKTCRGDPAVSFGSGTYTAAEGGSVTVTVNLSAAPTSAVTIPITADNQGGASNSDYSVPTSVTFATTDTSKTFTFTANDDLHIDDGESVLLGFGTLPVRVNAGTPSKSTVNIADTYCTTHAILCATLDFREGTSPGAQRLYLNQIDNDEFTRNGVDYWLADINVTQNSGHAPVDDFNIKWQHGYPERTRFDLRIHSPDRRPNGYEGFFRQKSEWLDWTLHVSTVSGGETVATELRLSEARLPLGSCCLMFFGRDIDDLRRTWQPGQIYDLRLVEDPRAGRTPEPLKPPMYLRINEEVARLVPDAPWLARYTFLEWLAPQGRDDLPPAVDSYKIQWKRSSGSWGTPADVTETITGPRHRRYQSYDLEGLTPGVEYNIRVIATDSVGDSGPSNEITYTLPVPAQQSLLNTPAEGEPRIDGTPEAGQTLSADSTGVTDADGLDDVVFQYQWLADGAVIAGATGSTYTLTSDDEGRAITVRVAFTDDAGNDESLTSAPTVVTAGLELQSATVDGAVLTLTYNKVLDNLVSVPSTAFAVNVNGAPRSVRGVGFGESNVLLFLSSAVEAGDTVTVDYTAPDGAGGIQDALGRKAGSFTGQVVTNNTAASGGGRSDPAEAPGTPDSLEVVRHESGKLRVSWEVADSGPAPTGYTVQWKESADSWADQDDVSEANVKETSHVITGLTDGVEYAVRVMARKGDAESTPSGEVAATPQETEPPAPSSASVDGATLTILFDEPLDPGETPAKSAFAVTVRDVGRGVETVAVSGSGVTITLAAAVCAGDAVSVGYTAPADASAVRLQDLAGNAAASFSEWQVTNNTGAAGQLTACARDVPASHDGSASFTFELRFSEEFSISYRTLRDHAFTVTGGEVVRAKRLEKGKNVRWEITVRPDGNGAVTITLPVTTDCEDEGAICTGDARMLSNRVELTVGGPGG